MPRPSTRTQSTPSRGKDRIVEFFREETTGGLLLIAATLVALLWANTANGVYHDIWSFRLGFGPEWLHLSHLTVKRWVADGLMAVFFFVVGLELKQEVLFGVLSNRRVAALPLAAAIGGMVVPILCFLIVARGAAGASQGWPIPMATDIAFALGVLSLAGASVPASLRSILLCLSIVDDLVAIALIAVLFTEGLELMWLGAAVALLGCYAVGQKIGLRQPFLYTLTVVLAWVCTHASGVHATVVAVAFGLLTRARPAPGEESAPAARLLHRLHPFSAILVVPLFALSSAGVALAPADLAAVIRDPLPQAVFVGLVIGKTIGVVGASWLAVRIGLAVLPAGVGWRKLFPIGPLAGIGYTVSLLMAQLALPPDKSAMASTAVILSSATASLVSIILLRSINASRDPSARGAKGPGRGDGGSAPERTSTAPTASTRMVRNAPDLALPHLPTGKDRHRMRMISSGLVWCAQVLVNSGGALQSASRRILFLAASFIIVPLLLEMVIWFIQDENYSPVRAALVFGLVFIALVVVAGAGALVNRFQYVVILSLIVDGFVFVSAGLTILMGRGIAGDPLAKSIIGATAVGTGLLVVVSSIYLLRVEKSGIYIRLGREEAPEPRNHLTMGSGEDRIVFAKFPSFDASHEEILMRCAEVLRLDGVHFIGYYAKSKCLFYGDILDQPRLNPYFRGRSRSDRREQYARYGAELDSLVTRLNGYYRRLEGGLLIRVVFDVEAGAIYYFLLSESESKYLIGVTLDQSVVVRADHDMAELVDRVRHLAGS